MARSTRTSGKGKKATATTTKQPAAKKAAKNGGGKGATSKAKTKRATNNTKAKGKGTKKALGKHNPNVESDEDIEDEGVPTKKEQTTRATRSRKVCGVVYYFNHGLLYFIITWIVVWRLYHIIWCYDFVLYIVMYWIDCMRYIVMDCDG